jgi:hypothetical protein
LGQVLVPSIDTSAAASAAARELKALPRLEVALAVTRELPDTVEVLATLTRRRSLTDSAYIEEHDSTKQTLSKRGGERLLFATQDGHRVLAAWRAEGLSQ